MTTKSFPEQIQDVIDKNIATYENDSDRITSDYRLEKGLTEAYNGRQLLELLQNADDAGTDKVLINIDTINNLLSISNNGTSFDINGVKSLMLANTSSKNKREFIGNKGLGFRSILNWVSEVKIKTKGTTLIFSPKIAKDNFEALVTDADIRKQMVSNEKDLPPGSVPFAVLAIPETVETHNNNEWTTIIEVKYNKECEGKIFEQLKEIKPEILLFLNHTETITIDGAGALDKILTLVKTEENGEKFLAVNDSKWQVFDSGELLLHAESEKYYRFKIAWKDDLSDVDTRFFTYFPTQVPTQLPYLIHATFDLDPTRNHFNKSEDNEFILHQIALKLADLAITKLQTPGESSWKSYQFLTVNGQSSFEILKPFFKDIEGFRNSLPIYPCLDGCYSTIDSLVFYNSAFSKWILEQGFKEVFSRLLLPTIPGSSNDWSSLKDKKYDEEEWHTKINLVGSSISSNNLRAELLNILLEDVFKPHPVRRYALLTNKEDKVISEEIVAFTPIILSESKFSKPQYLEFDFINRELYDVLVAHHKHKFDKDQPPAREIQRLFKELVNIQPYDSNNVISRIISGTKKELSVTQLIDHHLVIKEMVNSVYENFIGLNDRQEKFTEPFPLLNRKNQVVSGDELFLSATFPSGKLTEELYDGILHEGNFIQDLDNWGLKEADPHILETFFIWMGVNRYVSLKDKKFEYYKNHIDLRAYKDYVHTFIRERDNVSFYKFDGLEICKLEETVARLTIEKLIVLIKKEEKLFDRLRLNNADKLSHRHGNASHQEFSEKPSYVCFQLNQIKNYSDYVIEDYQVPFINTFSVEKHNDFFKKHNVSEGDVKYILEKLGAKASFQELSIEKVYQIIKDCHLQQADTLISRKVYSLAFNYFKLNKDLNFKSYNQDLEVSAIKDGKRDFRPVSEVYYSDNNTLPSKIIEQYWIFDFPKRNGEKQIAEYFGVKTFKDIKINIIKDSIGTYPDQSEFIAWLERIKPFILTYRLNTLNSKNLEREAAHTLKGASIQVVEKAIYSVDETDAKELLPGEFLSLGNNNFIICAPRNSSLDKLKENPSFCEAIAEIMCVLFEVNEGKDEYRAIFKDREDLVDTKYLIESKLLQDKLSLAIKHLGLSVEENTFWKAILSLKGKVQNDLLSSFEELNSLVKTVFHFSLPDYYSRVTFDRYDNKESIDLLKLLCKDPSITLIKIEKLLPNFPSLKNWHLNQIVNKANDIESLFGKELWTSLKDKTEVEKRKFRSIQNSFTPWFQHLKWDELDRLSFDIDYGSLLVQKTDAKFNLQIENAKTLDKPICLYLELLDEFQIEESQLSDEEKSLLYFSGYDEYFRTLFKSLKQVNSELEFKDDEKTGNDALKINFSAIEEGNAPAYSHSTSEGNNPSSGNEDHGKRTLQQKRAGKRAELLTRNLLRENYDVQWVSNNSDEADIKKSDAWGYDMRYKERDTDEWFYLEIKSVSNRSFIISSNEVNVALREKEKYHLGLVKDGVLNIVKGYFLDENRQATFRQLLSNNSIKPKDFEVYFSLSSNGSMLEDQVLTANSMEV